MDQTNFVKRWGRGLLIAFAGLAAITGAMQGGRHDLADVGMQTSAFVQSGGATADVEPSVPEASTALGHARARMQPEAPVPTF